MKHLIETIDSSSLPITEYDRLILNSATNDVIVCGGGYKANVLMVSMSGYQLYGIPGDDGQINYFTYEYKGIEKYRNKDYFKYSLSETDYILAPTRSITKVTFPFDDYYFYADGNEGILPFSSTLIDSLYGFTSVPENKVVMKPRTDIGTNAHGYSYVDLGLTSGTLWATMNVGASSETDYGSYFQWGDTVDKRDADCSWSTYKYCNGTENSLTKYNNQSYYGTVDNKTTLDLEDDAARVLMGGDWKMPTVALIEELAEETNSEWVTNYKGTNINGRKFTSKTNGNSIFIPASGTRPGSSFYRRGSYGYVWSSSLNITSPINALYLNFTSNGLGADGDVFRDDGVVVRGVL